MISYDRVQEILANISSEGDHLTVKEKHIADLLRQVVDPHFIASSPQNSSFKIKPSASGKSDVSGRPR